MSFSRRSLLRRSSLLLASLAPVSREALARTMPQDPFRDLRSMTDGVKPLSEQDYADRLDKARRLMKQLKMDLFVLEGGTSMEYFAGMRWGLSERMFAMLIPARGEIAYVCPKFEEGRAREQIRFGSDIRTWEEDQSPFERVRGILSDRGISAGTIGIEPTLREFIIDGMQKACSAAKFVNGAGISQGCRMIKTDKELQYMELANAITKRAFAAAFKTIHEGLAQEELSQNIAKAHSLLGAPGGASVSFGPNSASPHGSLERPKLKPGDVILVDGGCRVEGFRSDVTRTVVFGKPSDKVHQVWNIVKKAQEAAIAAARPGAPCEAPDAAARKVITDSGYGPDYRFFTHRVGHGIGMDGHEYPYLVRGSRLPLRSGMTFSNEPGIYIPGEFGVRIEDCIHVTDAEARFFGDTAPALETY